MTLLTCLNHWQHPFIPVLTFSFLLRSSERQEEYKSKYPLGAVDGTVSKDSFLAQKLQWILVKRIIYEEAQSVTFKE